MNNVTVISQFVNLLATSLNIIGINMKDKKKCLIFFILGNSLVATSLFLLSAFSGMLVQIIFVIETIINYCLEKKNENFKYPKWLILLYIIVPTLVLMLVYNSIWDILPIVAGILFPLAIVSKDFKLRLLNLFSVAVWVPYNFNFQQYAGTVSCAIFTILNFLAIVRLDLKKEKNNSSIK